MRHPLFPSCSCKDNSKQPTLSKQVREVQLTEIRPLRYVHLDANYSYTNTYEFNFTDPEMASEVAETEVCHRCADYRSRSTIPAYGSDDAMHFISFPCSCLFRHSRRESGSENSRGK